MEDVQKRDNNANFCLLLLLQCYFIAQMDKCVQTYH